MGTGTAYMGVAASIAFGANAAMNAIAARLKGTDDLHTLKFFFNRQIKVTSILSIWMIVFASFCWV